LERQRGVVLEAIQREAHIGLRFSLPVTRIRPRMRCSLTRPRKYTLSVLPNRASRKLPLSSGFVQRKPPSSSDSALPSRQRRSTSEDVDLEEPLLDGDLDPVALGRPSYEHAGVGRIGQRRCSGCEQAERKRTSNMSRKSIPCLPGEIDCDCVCR
jgi:hypothetical protein